MAGTLAQEQHRGTYQVVVFVIMAMFMTSQCPRVCLIVSSPMDAMHDSAVHMMARKKYPTFSACRVLQIVRCLVLFSEY